MKVVTLNLLCGTVLDPVPYRRHLRQASLLLDLDADVVCLQECNNALVEHAMRRGLGERYNFMVVHRLGWRTAVARVVVAAAFVALLAVFRLSLLLALLGTLSLLHVWLFFSGTQAGGLAFAVRKGIKVKKCSFRPFRHQAGDLLNLFQERGVLVCNLPHFGGTFGNTHLNRYHDQGRQARELARRRFRVLAGDMNTSSVTVGKMRRLEGGPTYGSQVIDHVWVSSGEWVVSEVDAFSDHKAVVAEERIIFLGGGGAPTSPRAAEQGYVGNFVERDAAGQERQHRGHNLGHFAIARQLGDQLGHDGHGHPVGEVLLCRTEVPLKI